MKNILLSSAMCVAALLLCGCVVTSVYPFYTKQDLVYEQALLGRWINADEDNSSGDESWTFTKSEETSYLLKVAENGGTTEFEAHLFELDGIRFLDLLTTDRHEYSIPVHFVLKCEREGSDLRLTPLNAEWFEDYLEEHPDAIRHHRVHNPPGQQGHLTVLTGDTPALRQFLRQHMANEEFFIDGLRLAKVKAE